MIADLKPYPAMKDSGVPWLGKVPEHWEVRRIKTFFREKEERSGNGSGVLLSLTRAKGIVPQAEASSRIASAEDLSKYKVCRPGDLVMNRMQAWSGMFALSTCAGVVSPDYSVFGAIEKSDVKFFEHLFKTPSVVDQFAQRSKGIGSGFNRLYTPDFGSVPAVVPPYPEQAAIVRFLDHADRRIRRYIRAKQKLIKLLEEQKQAIIHRAVTRGLDPNVRLKPSRVEWLGEVPEHWEVKRLRYLIEGKLTYGANAAAEHANPEWPRYLRITDFGVDGTLRSDTFRSLPPEIAKDYLVQAGDILLARSGATVGKAFLVTTEAGEACHAGYLIRARPRRTVIEPEFFFAFTQSTGFGRWKDSTFIIATIQNIGADKYADLPVPLPPVREQSAIVRFLQEATNTILVTIDRARREISLLREYRTRLIADVVTGKLDVRAASANLPVDTDEPEALNDREAVTAGEEDTAVGDIDTLSEEADA